MAVERAPAATPPPPTGSRRRPRAPPRSVGAAATVAAAAFTAPLVAVVATVAAAAAAASAASAAAAEPSTASAAGACPSPPTVADFSLAALGGTWYQAAMSARFAATVEAGAPCITAHYTPADAGGGGSPVAAVRSCMLLPPSPPDDATASAAAEAAGDDAFPAPDGGRSSAAAATTDHQRAVACTRGLLTTPDPDGAPGRLALSFPPRPAGRYWVLAVEGGPGSDGGGGGGGGDGKGGDGGNPTVTPYTTAVVWSCAEGDAPGEAATQDLLVLSRSRGLPREAVTAAAEAAAAVGVELGPDNAMVMTDQGEGCVYFSDEGVTVLEG